MANRYAGGYNPAGSGEESEQNMDDESPIEGEQPPAGEHLAPAAGRAPAARRDWAGRLTGLVSAAVVVLLAALPPHALLAKAGRVGFAICHQIPERSFFLGGHQLPLCARCTGTFLGAVVGLVAILLLRRGRASRLPPAAVLALLVAFTGAWAFDGLNSYLTLFPKAPHLYEPRNWLRVSTGVLNGITLISFVYPVSRYTLWRESSAEPVIRTFGELAAIVVAGAGIALVVQAEIGALLYPVAIFSSLGVLLLLTLLNAMIAAIVMRREGLAQTWRQALVPLSAGLAMGLLEIAALNLLRAWLEARLGPGF